MQSRFDLLTDKHILILSCLRTIGLGISKHVSPMCDQIALPNTLSSFCRYPSHVVSHKDVQKTVSDLPISFGYGCDSRQAMFKPLDAAPFDCVLPLELCYLCLALCYFCLADCILPLELCHPSLHFFDICEQPHAFFVTPCRFVSCPAIVGVIQRCSECGFCYALDVIALLKLDTRITNDIDVGFIEL